jgi:hypothetical protein
MLKKMLQEAKFTKTINYEMISNFNEANKNMADFGIVNEEDESLLEYEGEN